MTRIDESVVEGRALVDVLDEAVRRVCAIEECPVVEEVRPGVEIFEDVALGGKV